MKDRAIPKALLTKWLRHYAIALPVLAVVFAGVQYLKDRPLTDSLIFGVSWAFITLAVFALTRVYYFKTGRHCKVCDDLPERERGSDAR